ncbi:MAG TPA: DUF255 domain-containing protein [Lacunisphaera sp.]|jgi:hypothetical protein
MSKRSILFFAIFSVCALMASAASPLAGESSAYLRSQENSAVNWLPWGDAAFAKAKGEARPIFLFIGSASSELSRAMARQTFSNAETAALLNKNFVCILVDREEHTELAALYQTYLSEVKQLTGQPLNIWLTPELLPYEGAAYLPPTEEWGKSSFLKILQQAQAAWTTDAAGCRARAKEAVAQVGNAVKPTAPAASSPEKAKARFQTAADAWLAQFDATNGGFTDAPKDLEPELMRFLLREPPADRDAALFTLHALATSAVRDSLDGGFFRYATDARYRLPYPQKTLTDQARIALALLDAAKADNGKDLVPAARGALDYALKKLARKDGTFDAAEDATGDDYSGYYAWTEAEIDAALGADSAAFKKTHGVEPAGNITADDDLSGKLKGKNLLRATLTSDSADAVASAKLLAIRDQRPAPARDQSASAGVHGLLLAALSRAGEQLNEPRYLKAAAQLFDLIKKDFLLSPDGDLRRLKGSSVPAAPVDYTALALGCREFSRVTHRPDAGKLATRLLALVTSRFYDATSGRFYVISATLPPGIFVRPWAVGDVPSAESLAIQAGAPADQVEAMAAALGASVDEVSSPPSGDVLLALSLSH